MARWSLPRPSGSKPTTSTPLARESGARFACRRRKSIWPNAYNPTGAASVAPQQKEETMATVETNVVDTDQPAERTTAQVAKFKLEMTLLMIMAGRTDEAQQLVQQVFDRLEKLIADGH
jgi:hypothetical protein